MNKLAQDDLMGRVMAHAFTQELGNIEKTAGMEGFRKALKTKSFDDLADMAARMRPNNPKPGALKGYQKHLDKYDDAEESVLEAMAKLRR